jgi:hypothetical protein
MCDKKECVYIEICEDEVGDKYVGHYKYGKDKKTYELFFKQYWRAETNVKKNKTLKKKPKQFQYPLVYHLR